MSLLILTLLGILGGIIAGSMGVGGGIIFTPVLFFLFEEAGIENAVQWSVASGLLCTFVASATSTVRQKLHNNLFLREGIMLGICGAIGISIGKIVLTSSFYQREQFVVFFSIILFYSAFMMFKKGSSSRSEVEYAEAFSLKTAFGSGSIGGFIASLAGVGGGGIMVPIMNFIFKQPFRNAVSISHLGMTIMIFVGLVQLALVEVHTPAISGYTLGYIDYGSALPLALGGVAGANAGAIINHKVNRKYLQWGFAVLGLAMAGRLLWGVFG